MQRGQAAIVSARHRMDHVERFCPPDLADDDPLWTLTQCGALKKILHGDSADALNVRVALFEAEELRTQLVQPKLGLCLEDAGALALGDHQCQHSRQRRLASASGPAEDDVQPSPHRSLEEWDCTGRNR